ncbi:MAG: pesticidal protein Cry7Aa [Flavobacterium sp. BFFFF1]|uniref:glycoside hydrolase family 130 protein n=1 Tax=Flavobacterium sp. BFFFF1 TaxID=2015557 RepID=UPI000BD96565|nr:pesticidal protein Cry7Aa [Flavobacterium sp. BFFFF1]OYU81744.1 MAG: pesticidal protein Cry7Aa [Flavobacterium sp. BFFFF1]
MVSVTKHGIVLEKRDLDFEIEGVLNPAVIYENGQIHMLYRAVAKGNRSTIGYCRFSDPLTVAERYDHPIVVAEHDYEKHGVEDPRIVKIEDTYYLSYCAYDGVNAFGAVATSSDMIHFEKKGIIVPRVEGDTFREWLTHSDDLNLKYFRLNMGDNYIWDKNVIFFPRKVHGKLFFLHRIKPGVQIAKIKALDDLDEDFWKDYLTNLEDHIVLDPKYQHELSYIGNGCPPIETDQGWLIIYHGVHDVVTGYMYTACAALLDLENPAKEIARLPYALFEPEKEWELKGYINNVVFPTGTALIDDTLYIYYGAADERIACASVSLSELLSELQNNKTITIQPEENKQ